MKVYAVVSCFRGERVGLKAFDSLDRARDFFDWKRVNIDPRHYRFPADAVQLLSGDLTLLDEKGALAGAPRDSKNVSARREHGNDTPPPRNRAR
jgi:hypothetical protein